MGGLKMGVTEDQKILVAIGIVNKCDDVDLLIPLLNAAHDRIKYLTEIEHILNMRSKHEDVQE